MMAQSCVLLLSSDRDFASDVRALRRAGVRVGVVCRSSNVSEGYTDEADFVGMWDTLLQSSIVGNIIKKSITRVEKSVVTNQSSQGRKTDKPNRDRGNKLTTVKSAVLVGDGGSGGGGGDNDVDIVFARSVKRLLRSQPEGRILLTSLGLAVRQPPTSTLKYGQYLSQVVRGVKVVLLGDGADYVQLVVREKLGETGKKSTDTFKLRGEKNIKKETTGGEKKLKRAEGITRKDKTSDHPKNKKEKIKIKKNEGKPSHPSSKSAGEVGDNKNNTRPKKKQTTVAKESEVNTTTKVKSKTKEESSGKQNSKGKDFKTGKDDVKGGIKGKMSSKDVEKKEKPASQVNSQTVKEGSVSGSAHRGSGSGGGGGGGGGGVGSSGRSGQDRGKTTKN